MKTKLLTAGFLLAASVSPVTQASFVGIGWSPTGTGTPTVDLGAFDWAPTSFSAENGNAAILNYLTGSGSTDLTVYSHARLSATTDPFSNSNTPSGLNTAYEYTVVMGYVETVTNVDLAHSSADFITNLSGPSFLEVYYGARDSNALTGSGFRNGTLVMTGVLDTTVAAATGFFRVTNSAFQSLDLSADGNQYGVQKTQRGSGTNDDLVWKITGQDSRFFSTPIDLLQVANISQSLPFGSVNPSDCYTNNASGSAIGASVTDTECNNVHVNGAALNPGLQPLAPGFGGFVPNSGPNNTTLTGADANRDFIAQTDYNSPLTARQIPEPSSALLLGIGLLGMLGVSSRKKMS